MILGKLIGKQYLQLFNNTQIRGMATVSSKLVKTLRELTGSPLKDCMKVLEETEGDVEKAKDLLRKRGLVDAEKRSGRQTAEGLIGLKFDKAASKATMIEIHCETDFVARTN